ncbi:Chromosome partition protein Smc [Spiroplasma sp. JKS002669]|uniref:AAA family ATPase n=1 Tax=Spiroplasma attinicola TaxID=2904537 RepID=UPI00202300A1|nr:MULTISPECIES: AAA family ATPase [unclassified Spiroplasma]MCL6428552.1 Chromosome partition protein Smc [Spiroplasma sp. JKS002669]MCL8209885.1 Chromosome partition protein Smc [Spiroplasma sp. JKS002670]
MAFLKRIEAHGFKSFADDLKIEFNTNIVGIVGPNGSGKSNINDAIRWVLGEQSVKSLRGEKADDIIFNGAQGKAPLNMAQVTLVFDNSSKIFNSEFNEIAITRKVYRNSSENEYYINKNRVRLKDVQNLVIDTGLSKGSLAIISQGNVSKFADSKPEERRTLFEEAAGVAKYKKRKEESLRKLERTNENLVRVEDIVSEISRKIEPLAKQAEKAKNYLAISNTLKQYEITLLVKDGQMFKNQLKVLTNNILKNEQIDQSLKLKINNHQEKVKFLRNRNYELEKNINSVEMNLTNINNLLNILEQQKKVLQDQAKQAQDKAKNLSEISKLKANIQDLLNIISHKKIIKEQEQENLKLLNDKLANFILQRDDVSISRNDLFITLGKARTSLDFFVSNQERERQKNFAVETILDNRNSLYGVIDTIANLIEVPELYQQAIAVIFGNNLKNIVTKTDKDATKAVNFLKENRAGIATFLPLNTIQTRTISQEDVIIVNSQLGFIAFANNLVKTKSSEYQKAIDFLLARTIVCETLDNARDISKLMAARYQCVTLDGQLIKAGGAIVGGFQRQNSNLNLLRKDNNLETIRTEIKDLEVELVNLNVQSSSFETEINSLQAQKAKTDLTISKLNSEILDLENRSQVLSTEYQSLTGKKIVLDDNQELNDIFAQYQKNKYQQENFTLQLQTLRQEKHQGLTEMQGLENEVYQFTQEYNNIVGNLNSDKLEKVQLENKLEQILKRLVDAYHLTFDRAQELYHKPLDNEAEARELVFKLRNDLEDLGFVNLNAIEEYETENERYQNLKGKHQELTAAVKELLQAIDEMDKIMVEKFDETIKQINHVLPETFQTLFGGGNCQLKYSQPDNILTTGIEVLANPPGKRISNLNLLSGGEKSLVALSVLFAILKVKPLPLTILDEVEAPLDPANLERFARYVRNFSQTTQFIIVTHRPGTMENCDVLYGTTMENQGVTKMVNIKLSDAKKTIISDLQQSESITVSLD